MADAADMSTPVTRGELRDEFQSFKQELGRELTQELASKKDLQELGRELRQELASKKELRELGRELREELASKKDLQELGRELRQELASKKELQELGRELRQELASKKDLEMWGGALLARIDSRDKHLLDAIAATEQRLLAELARHTRAAFEQMSTQISGHDEKYADLPERVNRLETAVFGSKPG
jgi:chromosome segregation ATPase